jgi:hypothetical protein
MKASILVGTEKILEFCILGEWKGMGVYFFTVVEDASLSYVF